MYWTDLIGYRIGRVQIDGSGIVDLIGGLDRPHALAFDELHDKLFWASGLYESTAIMWANPDGSEVDEFRYLGDVASSIANIAVDPARGMVYWRMVPLGSRNSLIQRANLDGSMSEDVAAPYFRTGGLVVDPVREKLYWTDRDLIRRANLDGSMVEDVIDTELPAITDLAIDVLRGKIYWLGFGINRANLDGSDVELVISNSEVCGHFRGLVIEPHSEMLLWTCSDYSNESRIRAFEMNSGKIVDLFAEAVTTANETTVLPRDLAIDPKNRVLYWTTSGVDSIRRMALDAGGTESLINGGEGPRMIALDVSAGKMYWTDRTSLYYSGTGRILRANLDGSEIETVLELPEDGPWGIALDTLSGRMYWTDVFGRRIRRADLNGANASDVLTLQGESTPFGIALDTSSGKMYWTVGAFKQPLGPSITLGIQRANLDGSSVEVLIDKTDPVIMRNPILRGIALNPSEGKMYWSSWNDELVRTDGSIHRASLDGSGAVTIVTGSENRPIGTPVGVAVDVTNSMLYWTETVDIFKAGSRIRRSYLDGTGVESLITVGLVRPWGIAINPTPHILSIHQPICLIDSAQPHEFDDPLSRQGWDVLDLPFSGPFSSLRGQEFVLTEFGSDGVPPAIIDLNQNSETNAVRIQLDHVIEPQTWICVKHVNSGTSACFGSLPGDVNQDGLSGPLDILDLINAANGVPNSPSRLAQLDIDRSGEFGPADILRLVDLLNGAGEFESWNEASMPPCPLK